jgi:hypothetical protein
MDVIDLTGTSDTQSHGYAHEVDEKPKTVFRLLADQYARSFELAEQKRKEKEYAAALRAVKVVKLQEPAPLSIEDLKLFNKFIRCVASLSSTGQFKHRLKQIRPSGSDLCQDEMCLCVTHFLDDPCDDHQCSCIAHYEEHFCHPDNACCRLYPAPPGHSDYNPSVTQWKNLPRKYVACLASGKVMSHEIHVCHAACPFLVHHTTRGIYCSKSGLVVDGSVLAQCSWNSSSRAVDDGDGPEDASERFERSRDKCMAFSSAMNNENARTKVDMTVKAMNHAQKRKIERTKNFVIGRLTRDYAGPLSVPLPSEAELRLERQMQEAKEKAESPDSLAEVRIEKVEAKIKDREQKLAEDSDEDATSDVEEEDEDESTDDIRRQDDENVDPGALIKAGLNEHVIAKHQQQLIVQHRDMQKAKRAKLMMQLRPGAFVVGDNPVKWAQLNNVRVSNRETIRYHLTNAVSSVIEMLLHPNHTITNRNRTELTVVCAYNYINMRHLHEIESRQKKYASQEERCLLEGVSSPSLLSGNLSPLVAGSNAAGFDSYKRKKERAIRLHVFSVENYVAATIRLLCNPNSTINSYTFMTESNFKDVSSWSKLLRVSSNTINLCASKLQDAIRADKFPQLTPFKVQHVPVLISDIANWLDLINYNVKKPRAMRQIERRKKSKPAKEE